MEWAALAKAAEMQGGAQQVLEMTIQYGKDRVQFDPAYWELPDTASTTWRTCR